MEDIFGCPIHQYGYAIVGRQCKDSVRNAGGFGNSIAGFSRSNWVQTASLCDNAILCALLRLDPPQGWIYGKRKLNADTLMNTEFFDTNGYQVFGRVVPLPLIEEMHTLLEIDAHASLRKAFAEIDCSEHLSIVNCDAATYWH